MKSIQLRTATPKDRAEIAELIYASTNAWYQLRGMTQIFAGGPETTEVFSEVYDVLEPGCCVVAENSRTGRLMGSCFYHPRPQHVSLGIMNVHPNYFGHGVARALLDYIIDYTDRHGYKALRLTQSALNLDSFSLYNSAGFVPRCAYQDMMLQVPEAGLSASLPGLEHVREATPDDVSALVELELSVSGISRETDYRFCIKNGQGFWHVSVYEVSAGKIEGFLISSGHPAFNPGFPFWILAASILRSFSLEGKPFLTAGTHRAGPKCLHWTLSFSEGDNSSVGRQFFRHSSELHSAASRFRTRERPFYPLGSGSAQILCSMSPNSLRFRCPSANNNQ